MNSDENIDIKQSVRDAYSRIAQTGGSCCGSSSGPATVSTGGCGCGCGSSSTSLGTALGYDEADLAALPEGADMGLSCGNPLALSLIAPGETVLDLGSGGGFDVFQAATKVGAEGRVIGVDMTPAMLDRARRNAMSFTASSGLANVEFRLGEIEHLPVPDGTIDLVISNCVINLSTDKPQVWREIARVLRTGGRVSVSDLALLRPLPQGARASVEAYVGCIAGAALVDDTQAMMRDAGLDDIKIIRKDAAIASMVDASDPLYKTIIAHLPDGTSVGDFVTSIIAGARKK